VAKQVQVQVHVTACTCYMANPELED